MVALGLFDHAKRRSDRIEWSGLEPHWAVGDGTRGAVDAASGAEPGTVVLVDAVRMAVPAELGDSPLNGCDLLRVAHATQSDSGWFVRQSNVRSNVATVITQLLEDDKLDPTA